MTLHTFICADSLSHQIFNTAACQSFRTALAHFSLVFNQLQVCPCTSQYSRLIVVDHTLPSAAPELLRRTADYPSFLGQAYRRLPSTHTHCMYQPSCSELPFVLLNSEVKLDTLHTVLRPWPFIEVRIANAARKNPVRPCPCFCLCFGDSSRGKAMNLAGDLSSRSSICL